MSDLSGCHSSLQVCNCYLNSALANELHSLLLCAIRLLGRFHWAFLFPLLTVLLLLSFLLLMLVLLLSLLPLF